MAFGFFAAVHVRVWSPAHGLTQLLLVGREFDDRGTAVFRATPKYIDPHPANRWGFDGQLYAELALDPLLRDPRLARALDNAPYRAQRILVPWLAWLFGLGRPDWVINVYAGLNLLFWLPFAWLAMRLFRPHGWTGLAGLAATLVTCGVIESMQSALTDFPSFVLAVAALVAGGTAGAWWLALAALARGTSLLAFVGLAEIGAPGRAALRRNLGRGLIAAVPLGLWIAYVLWRFRDVPVTVVGGNLDWPLRAIMEKLGEFSVVAAHGPIRWHRWFFELYKSYELHALLTILALLAQCVFVWLHRDWRSPLWRWGAASVAYFSCIGFLAWESHITITRHALPITLVFNLLLAARPGRWWLGWFLIGNCFVPHTVRQFWRFAAYEPSAAPAEFVVTARGGTPVPLTIAYADGWTGPQWEPGAAWRWATGSTATVWCRHRGPEPVRAEFACFVRTPIARELAVTLNGRSVLRRRLPGGRELLTIPGLELPPGESRLVFEVDAEPLTADDGTPGRVTIKIENPRVSVAAATASPP